MLYNIINIRRSLFCILIVSIISCGTTYKKIKNSEVEPFTIVVERTNNEMKLTCTNGCSWKELKFNAKGLQNVIAIDENGMTDVLESSKASGFFFTIETTQKEISLKGLKGTSWKQLKFHCLENHCKQTLDQNGMAGNN
jgi:hypothetical protein